MKAGSIALIILSLILPASVNSLAEGIANNESVGIDPSSIIPVLGNLSNEKFLKNEPENFSIRWYKRKDTLKLHGVALVIHGLNCRPGKMEPIITQMAAAGIDCLNLSLRGHGENYNRLNNTKSAEGRMEAFKSVTYQVWKTEACQAYQLVKRKSNLYGAPLFFIGFSMGGLLGVDLFASNPNVRFDKMLLLAPALKMRNRNYILEILSPFSRLVVPSIAHKSYLANDGTPIAAYNALFEMYEHFKNNPDPIINIPTIVFIDEQDELISFSGLQNMVRNQNLDQWTIHPLKKDNTVTKIKMHHLIIDETSVGKKMWQEMVKITINHFLGRLPAETKNK